jgi:DNA-binding LytR/AlgR family response regulator
VLRPEYIAFIKVEDKRIIFFDIHGNQGSRFESLTSMEEKLKEDERFFKSHRSCLVNIYHIKSIDRADRETFYLSFNGNCTEKALISETKFVELKKILFTV